MADDTPGYIKSYRLAHTYNAKIEVKIKRNARQQNHRNIHGRVLQAILTGTKQNQKTRSKK